MVSSKAMVVASLRRDSHVVVSRGTPGGGGSMAFFFPGWRSQSQRLTLAWRKGKRANGKNPNLAPKLFTSPAAGARRRGRRWSGGRAAKSQRIGIEGGGGELEGSRHATLYEAPAGSKPLQHKACAHRIGEDPRCICCQNKIEYENPLSLGNRRSGGGEVISQSVGDLDSIPLPGCPRRAG